MLYCEKCKRPIPDEEVRSLQATGSAMEGTSIYPPLTDNMPEVSLPKGAHKLDSVLNNGKVIGHQRRITKTVYFHFPAKEDLDN